MCLAVPMRLTRVEGEEGRAALGGVEKEVNLALLRDLREGDWIIVHAGFAIQKLDEAEAEKTLAAWRELAAAR